MRPAETINRRGLREIQSRKLERLLAEVLPANRFYARKLAAAGVDAAAIRSVEDLAALPFTVKEELQEDQSRTPPTAPS